MLSIWLQQKYVQSVLHGAPIDNVTDPDGYGNNVVNVITNKNNTTNTSNMTNTNNTSNITNTSNTANNVTNTH